MLGAGAKAALLLFFAVVVQVTIVGTIGVLGGAPDLVLVILVAIALLNGAVFGAISGFWAGLLLDVSLLGTLGFTSLLLTLAGFWVGRYGETVHLAVWDGRPVCIDARSGRLNTSVPPFKIGEDLPASSTALGKVLLAGRPRDEIEQFLSVAEQAGLGQVAAQGFAYEEQEHRLGACSVAAPIINPDAGVFASIGMSVPTERWRRGQIGYRRAVVAVAEHLARCSGRLQRNPKLVSA